ncbi:MAG: O-antigen ligase family protein [Candidatus Omnitrophica bacterium]|nr:O-antigen ligase family protein [Candidatus Omnitrophota bacterium]
MIKTLLFLLFTVSIPIESKVGSLFNFGGGLNYTTFFLLILLFSWFFSTQKKGEGFFLKNPLNAPISLFVIIVFAYLWIGHFRLDAPIWGNELNAYKRFVTPFILFFVTVNNIKEKKTMKVILYAMIFTIFLIALFSCKEYARRAGEHYARGLRVSVVGLQTNHLGAFFAQYLPVPLAFFVMNSGIVKRGAYLTVFILGTAALMVTFSRGAYLSFIAGLSAILIFCGGRRIWKIAAVGALIILVVVCIVGPDRFLPTPVRERVESIQDRSDRSITNRELVWEQAREYIRKSPIIGYGYGASKYLLFMDSHNMYYDLMLETGIFGIMVFLWILLRGFWLGRRLYKDSSDTLSKTVGMALMGSLFALAVGNIFGTRLDLVATNTYFMMLLGIAVRLTAINASTQMGHNKS